MLDAYVHFLGVLGVVFRALFVAVILIFFVVLRTAKVCIPGLVRVLAVCDFGPPIAEGLVGVFLVWFSLNALLVLLVAFAIVVDVRAAAACRAEPCAAPSRTNPKH